MTFDIIENGLMVVASAFWSGRTELSQKRYKSRFVPTVTGRFAKRLYYVHSSHRCSNLGIALNLLGLSEMGSVLIIVVKLYFYTDSDVGNLRTIKYFRDYCRPFRNT